ncbi:hypothetical protein C8Q79DRAFT_917088 [Trametes meyenii]|nr:hypothetical protein C8Q79DRAFT_917088 [Trametes meyenii]
MPRSRSPEETARDEHFYSDHIVFQVRRLHTWAVGIYSSYALPRATRQVENRLFKVPKRKFVDNSEVFEGMFEIPGDPASVEGNTDEKPLTLEGIKKDEFRALLGVMFKPHYAPTWSEKRQPSMEEWILVLKLTTMWQFASLRRVSIDALTPLLGAAEDPARWISLARLYDVNEWLFPALHALARRTKALQFDEVEPLGLATAIKMAEVRESFVGCRPNHTYISGGYSHSTESRNQHDFGAALRRLFGNELKE